MRIIIKKPKQKAYVTELNGDLEEVKFILGGNLEPKRAPYNNSIIYVNKESKALNLERNYLLLNDNGILIDEVFGTVIVCGYNEFNKDTSLLEELIPYYLTWFDQVEFYSAVFSDFFPKAIRQEQDEYERKTSFVEDFGKILKKHNVETVTDLRYERTKLNGCYQETVTVLFQGGGSKRVNVTLDSLAAIVRDIMREGVL